MLFVVTIFFIEYSIRDIILRQFFHLFCRGEHFDKYTKVSGIMRI